MFDLCRRILAIAMLVGLSLSTAMGQAPDSAPGGEDPFQAPAEEVVTSDANDMTPIGLFRKNPLATIGSILPFAIASLIAIWFGAERLVVLRRARVIPKPFVDRFLMLLRSGALDRSSAIVLCSENDSPVAHVFAHGARKWGRPSVEVEQAIIDGGERQVSQMRKHLRIINGVATISPLVGLLGTVVGMMMAFFNLAGSDGGNRAEQLAVGIVTALGTTALGLAIAIPCLILYMYLVGRIDALVMEMDELAQHVVNRISAEGLATNPPAPKSGRSRSRAAEPVS